jgi:hypothetical protein
MEINKTIEAFFMDYNKILIKYKGTVNDTKVDGRTLLKTI